MSGAGHHRTTLHADHFARLEAELEVIMEVDFNVLMAAFATVDGFQISLKERHTSKPSGRLAAMTSSLSALGNAVTEELTMGDLECVLVEAATGRMVMTQVVIGATTVILSVVTKREALLGKVLAACRDSAARLARDLASNAQVTA